MDIKTKFSNGDTVFRAYTNWGPSGETACEECGGTGRLKIEGKSLTIKCTKYGCSDGKIQTYNFVPLVQQLTIGQVNVSIAESPGTGDTMFDNYKAQHKREESYMAIETGIGSGNVYYVQDLFATEDEAREAGKIKVFEAIEWRKAEDDRLEHQRQQEAQRLQLEESEYV